MVSEQPITILLVEDDTDFLELLEEKLKLEGYEVWTAESGESALEIAAMRTFDLVITDVKLGGIDGLDTLQELKLGNSEFQSLVITGYATEDDSVRAISLGVGDYLRKPFTLQDFLRAVNRLTEEIYQDRKQTAFIRYVRDATLWGMETLLEQTGHPNLVSAAAETEQSGLREGLGKANALHLRMAVLALSIRANQLQERVPFFFQLLPEETNWILESLQTGSESQSLELHLVRSTLDGLLDLSREALRVQDGRHESSQTTREPVSTAGSFLALARAFEVSGDLSAASKALERLDGQEFSCQSLLLKARVEQSRGRNSEAEALVEQAEGQAQDLSQRSRVKLEGGLLLHEMGSTELALEWVQASLEGFQELSHSAYTAQAGLALGWVSGDVDSPHTEALSQLLAPGCLETFLGSARWLYPYALSLPLDGVVQRALQRLTRDLPGLVGDSVRSKLDPEQKIRALEIIGEVGIDGYDDLLQELMLDGSMKVRNTAQDLLRESASIRVAPALRLYSMGTQETWVGERRIPDKGWTGTKPSYLLYYLAQRAGRLVSQDHLIELFWPDTDRGKKNLNQTIFIIRDSLRLADWPEEVDYIFRNGNHLALSSEQTVWFDAGVVQDSLTEAQRLLKEERSAEAAELFQQAMELDRGEYLNGNYDDWALAFRDQLRREISGGLRCLAEIRQGQGRAEEAATVCRHLLNSDPLDEAASKGLFEALISLGRPLDVVRAFEKLERKMKRELDLEPNTDLVKLYHIAKLKL